MLLESVLVGAVVKTLHDANKSLEMDDKAREKYAKAFTKQAEAQLLVDEKKRYADKKLENVAKKKRAILNVSIPKFAEVYEQIQKVNIESNNTELDLLGYTEAQKQNLLSSMSIVSKKEMTDKELIVGHLFGGLGGLMIEDSKRNLSAARSQESAANVVYSQAQSISEFYDAISGRADRIAKLLVQMNALFIGSISETEKTIAKNGTDVRSYSERDKHVLMMCVNIAIAMTKIINIPVLSQNGEITKTAVDMLSEGENTLKKINQLSN